MNKFSKYVPSKQLPLILGSLALLVSAWSSQATAASDMAKSSDNQALHQATKGATNTNVATPIHSTGQVTSALAAWNLIQQDGQVIKPLLDFLNLFDIKHQNTLISINDAMQTHFLRKKGLERWDLADTVEEKRLRPKALELLKSMYMVEGIAQQQVDVDYFLLFGATLPTAEERFNDFLNQYKKGTVKCRNIVLLGGVRKLLPTELKKMKTVLGTSFKDFLKEVNKTEKTLTEANLWSFLWKTKATKELKAAFQKSKNLFFINATDTTQGTNNRATTVSTLEEWLTTCQPIPGSCHANVEQPYARRMADNLRLALEKYSKTLPNATKSFSITWNSSTANPNLPLAIYKDELARTFYQEHLLKKYLSALP